MPIGQINPGTAFHRSPNRMLAFLVGGAYVVFGLLGFFWVNDVPFAGPGDGGNAVFALWEVNPLLNIVHLLIGSALLIASGGTAASAKSANATVGALFLLLGIVGFFLAAPDGGRSAANFLSVNIADGVTHILTALLLLATSVGADRGVTRASELGEHATQRA